MLCSGSRNRQARLRTSGIISQDQPGINHPTLAHVQVITLYTTLHAKQAAVTTCRKARAKKKKKKKRKSEKERERARGGVEREDDRVGVKETVRETDPHVRSECKL